MDKKLDKKKVVFLSGAITGVKNYKEIFGEAEKILEKEGFAVLNPAWLPSEGLSYNDCMYITGSMLKKCDCIYFLPGWQASKGARHEYKIAKELDKEILYWESFREKPKSTELPPRKDIEYPELPPIKIGKNTYLKCNGCPDGNYPNFAVYIETNGFIQDIVTVEQAHDDDDFDKFVENKICAYVYNDTDSEDPTHRFEIEVSKEFATVDLLPNIEN